MKKKFVRSAAKRTRLYSSEGKPDGFDGHGFRLEDDIRALVEKRMKKQKNEKGESIG